MSRQWTKDSALVLRGLKRRLSLAAFVTVLAVLLAIACLETGFVPRFPAAIPVTALILDMVVRGRREVRRLSYQSFPAPGALFQRAGAGRARDVTLLQRSSGIRTR